MSVTGHYHVLPINSGIIVYIKKIQGKSMRKNVGYGGESGQFCSSRSKRGKISYDEVTEEKKMFCWWEVNMTLPIKIFVWKFFIISTFFLTLDIYSFLLTKGPAFVWVRVFRYELSCRLGQALQTCFRALKYWNKPRLRIG